MINIDNKFDIGQIVYLKTDPEQMKRMITAFTVTKSDLIYEVSCGANVSKHYDYEMSEEVNVLMN